VTQQAEQTDQPAGTERWRNRIKERVVMRVGDLLDHEGNPWSHPERQQEQVEGLLNEIGKIDSIKAWRSERLNGKLCTWDGHLRKHLDPDELWPVDITDLTDEEADVVIAVYNRTGYDAQLEGDLLDALLEGAQVTDLALLQMLDELAEESDLTRLNDPSVKEGSKGLGKKPGQVKIIIGIGQLGIVEQALQLTGLKNRADALEAVCLFFIDTHEG
jgi:hypothetical protein